MRPIVILVLAVTLSLQVLPRVTAQSPPEDSGRTFLKFLKAGDAIGVQSVDGTTSVVISTYGDSEFQVAERLVAYGTKTVYAQELAQESKLIKEALATFLADNAESDFDAGRVMVIPLMRTSLGEVLEIGDDYILVKLRHKSNRRAVIPKASIGKIYLDANPLRLLGPRRSKVSRSN